MARTHAAFRASLQRNISAQLYSRAWTGNIGSIYATSDQDIDFYDTNSARVSLGIGSRF
ncbi:MAG: DUF2860 family protein [Gammaproteobacteria bacterium]